MAVTIQSRRDTAANWNTADPVLALGELGIETDTDKAKYGDGFTTWKQLDYFIDKYDGKTLPPGTEMDQTLRYDSINQNWKATSDLVVKANGSVTASGDVTADAFIGDGSQLTNLPAGSQWDDVTGGINYAGGNVGIGTANPQVKLHVDRPSSNEVFRVSRSDGNAKAAFWFSSNVPRLFMTPNVGGGSAIIAQNNGEMSLHTNNTDGSSVANERMRIDSAGNVGIGTDAPTNNLHVSQGLGAGAERPTATMRIDSNSGVTELHIAGTNASVGQIRFGDESSNYRGALTYDHATDAMIFVTAAAERVRIDAEGRVDITGSLYVNGQPKIGYSELLTTLVTLRSATMDETTVEGLRDSIANAIGGLIEKFEAEIGGIKDDAGSAVEPGTKL